MWIASAALLGSLLLFTGILSAEDDLQPRIEGGRIGFNMVVRPGKWSPIIVTVSNPGPEIHGTIDLETRGSKEVSSRIFNRPVYVPARCRRIFSYPVKFEPDTAPVSKKKSKKSDVTSYTLRLAVSDIVVHSDNFFCKVLNPYPHCVVGIDRHGGRYRGADGGYLKQFSREIHTEGWPPRNAPRRMSGYLAADTLVLADTGTDQLSIFQQKAIVEWVQAGGLLIFSPGTDVFRYDGTILGDILPVRPTGVRMVNNLHCLDRFGTFSMDKSIPVLESVFIDGDILLSEGDMPVVVLKSIKLGTVLFVAPDMTDDGFRKWGGFKDFFVYLSDRQSNMLPNEERLMARESERILNSFAGLKVPKRRSVVIYLLVVMAVILVPPYLLRKTGREGIGWAAVLGACVVFTLAAHAAGKRMKGIDHVSVNEIYFAKTVSGWSKAKHAGFAGIITPRRISTDIMSNSHNIVLDAMGRSMGGGAVTVFENVIEDMASVRRFLVNENSMRAFTYKGLADLGGSVSGKCLFTQEGLVLRVRNDLPCALNDGFLKFNRLVLNVPDIAPGEETEVVYGSSSSPAGLPSYTQHTLSGREGIIRSQLRKCFFPDPAAGSSKQGAAFSMLRNPIRYSGAAFFSWPRRTSGCFRITDGEEARSVGLLGVRLPVTREGKQILVPRGVCEMKILSKMAFESRSGEVMRGLFPAQFEVEFILPDACIGMRADRLRIFWDFRSKNTKAKIEIGRAAGGKVEYADVGQDNVIDVPDAGRFVDGGNTGVTLKISMEGPEGASVLVDTSWQLWGLDIEVEGVIND